jgi:hypothetical protein
MEFWISREDGPELGQQPMNSDANRRSHDGTRTTHEGNTKMWIFYSSLYPQDTRRPHDGYTASYWEYDAFELEHEGVTWPPDDIKLSAVGNSVDQVRGHLRAKFKIPYSYGHLVSISGQCDASIGQMLAFLSGSKARIYKLYFFRQCINIVYISFPRSYFHRVTCFVINEYKSECSVVSAIRDVMPVPQKALNNQVLTTMAI